MNRQDAKNAKIGREKKRIERGKKEGDSSFLPSLFLYLSLFRPWRSWRLGGSSLEGKAVSEGDPIADLARRFYLEPAAAFVRHTLPNIPDGTAEELVSLGLQARRRANADGNDPLSAQTKADSGQR